MSEGNGSAVAGRLHRRDGLGTAVFAGLLLLTGCDGGVSEAQLSYDACVESYNDTFRSLPGSKAIVSGVTGSTSQCFWVWSSASVEDAISSALANCHEKQARCFVFATDAGLSGWSAQISSNGGVDRGVGGGGGFVASDGDGTTPSEEEEENGGSGSGSDGMSFGDFLDITNAILGGVAGAMGNGAVGGGHVGGGVRSTGSNAATCQQYLNLANQCRQRQRSMNSVGSDGLGTSGQAGSFNDCYNMYMGFYNAQCR